MQLGIKQLLVLIPATAVIGALALFGTLADSRQTLTEEFGARLRGVLETGAVALAVPLASGDGESVAAIIKELGRKRDVVCVAVTSRDQQTWRAGRSPCGNDLVYLTTPVRRGERPVGDLELWYSLAPVDAELERRAGREMMLVAFLCFAVAAAAFAVQTFFVRRPLVRFLDAIRSPPEGGQMRKVDWSSSDELGTVIAAYNEITTAFAVRNEEHQRNAKELWHLANHDTLTGLSNRRFFMSRADEELGYALRQGEALTLLMVDIDHFKRINDTYGHECGDEVLRRLAAIFRVELRTEDVCARLGGEEFAILLRHTALGRATEIAERIRAQVELAAIHFGERELHVTISIGIADALAGGGRSITRALSGADRALYRAKNGGRNRVVVDGPGGSEKVSLKLVWDGEFASGHPQIDAEHEALIDAINRYVRRIQQRDQQSGLSAEFLSILEKLAQHCRNEEKILAAAGWNGLADHARLHGTMSAHGMKLYERLASGEDCIAETLDFLVREVAGDHLAHDDTGYFPEFGKPNDRT